MSANAKATKRKKRLSAVEKAILRYGASQIIDLSAQMRKWFSIEDRDFIMKDYEALLQVSEMPDEECSFVKIVEDVCFVFFEFILVFYVQYIHITNIIQITHYFYRWCLKGK
jgi:hypothetical protein